MSQSTSQPKKARLILSDGTEYTGYSFGYEGSASGEVVFNTAMTGYPESLTDPSYEGQILVTSFPLLGNYGVPAGDNEPMLREHFEGSRIHCRAIIAQDYSYQASHWQATRTLAQWLNDEKVPGLYGIDTRALVKHLRDHGSMLGRIVVGDSEMPETYDPNTENLIAKTSCDRVILYTLQDDGNFKIEYPEGNPAVLPPSDKKTVVLVDCGVKHNIIRCLAKRGVRVVRVPWNYDFTRLNVDGYFISNGPGNPDFAEATVGNIRKALVGDVPLCGICMGNQLLAKAAGAKVYKLKYGHRSHNQPVRMEGTDKCFITSQNHGFAVDAAGLGKDWEPLFTNMNDGTNEGIRHKSKPFFSAQFHPEASSGPTDTEFLFDEFVKLL